MGSRLGLVSFACTYPPAAPPPCSTWRPAPRGPPCAALAPAQWCTQPCASDKGTNTNPIGLTTTQEKRNRYLASCLGTKDTTVPIDGTADVNSDYFYYEPVADEAAKQAAYLGCSDSATSAPGIASLANAPSVAELACYE